jgi:hypothetical protein
MRVAGESLSWGAKEERQRRRRKRKKKSNDYNLRGCGSASGMCGNVSIFAGVNPRASTVETRTLKVPRVRHTVRAGRGFIELGCDAS